MKRSSVENEDWEEGTGLASTKTTGESCGRNRGRDVGGRDEDVKVQSERSEWEATAHLGIKWTSNQQTRFNGPLKGSNIQQFSQSFVHWSN